MSADTLEALRAEVETERAISSHYLKQINVLNTQYIDAQQLISRNQQLTVENDSLKEKISDLTADLVTTRQRLVGDGTDSSRIAEILELVKQLTAKPCI